MAKKNAPAEQDNLGFDNVEQTLTKTEQFLVLSTCTYVGHRVCLSNLESLGMLLSTRGFAPVTSNSSSYPTRKVHCSQTKAGSGLIFGTFSCDRKPRASTPMSLRGAMNFFVSITTVYACSCKHKA